MSERQPSFLDYLGVSMDSYNSALLFFALTSITFLDRFREESPLRFALTSILWIGFTINLLRTLHG